jgi:pyrimidine-nucleoside phosphorylase
MNPVELITLKRNGEELSDKQLQSLLEGFVAGRVPDYQMSAFAMAVYFQGMSERETISLTRLMLDSGVSLDWSSGPAVVDKHSTGGVGDKVSLVLAPLLAACGVRVPMISGRGLGPTGGTLDKLESIPGFRTDYSIAELQHVVNSVGCVITGATHDLVPADRKLYALRDVTATVPSIPLITASILSKKLAESLDALVLDVKYGSGAFMQSAEQAQDLARTLVRVGNHFGVSTTAYITNMNQPLGAMCGNALEVAESIECLQGGGPADLRELTLTLAKNLVEQTQQDVDPASVLDSGQGFEKFNAMVVAQGGDALAALEIAKQQEVVEAASSGFVAAIDTQAIGRAVIELGGGRKQLNDAVDHSVGIEMLVKIGDSIERGQPLARVYQRASPTTHESTSSTMIEQAIRISEEQPQVECLVNQIID